MDIQEVYKQFMNVAEYGHTKIEAFIMTKDLYLKLLNSDLKKSYYEGGLRIELHNNSLCSVKIHGYLILISKNFKELYAFDVLYFENDKDDSSFRFKQS